MSLKLYEENEIREIAVAIREKNADAGQMDTSEMPTAIRAIETGGGATNCVVLPMTLSADVTGQKTILVNNDIIKQHWNDETLSALLVADNPITTYHAVNLLMQCNKKMGYSNYGQTVYASSSADAGNAISIPLNSSASTAPAIGVTSAGNLLLKGNTSRYFPAGTWKVTLSWKE